MDVQEKKRYLFIVYVVVLAIISYLLVRPFFSPLLTGVLFSYLLFPMHCFLDRRIKNKNAAAFLLLFGICFLVILPSVFLVDRLASESVVFYAYVKHVLVEGIPCIDGLGCRLIHGINVILSEPLIARFVNILVEQLSSLMVTSISGVAVQSLYFFFEVLIALFVAYYGLVEGPRWATTIQRLFPLPNEIKDHFTTQLRRISSAILIGFFFVAIIEGFLGYIAFTIVGSSAPLFWALIIAFTALVPFISAVMIMIPAMIYYVIIGQTFAAVIFISFAVLLFYVDTFLPPFLVGNSMHIHPLIVFIGLLGGVQLLGLVGAILGPFILSFSLLLLKQSLSR